MVSNNVSNIPYENSWYTIQTIFSHWTNSIRIIAYALWSNSVYICNFNKSSGNMDFDWQKLVTNSDFKRTIEIRLPYIAFGGKLYASYAFPVRLDSIPKVTLDDYYIDGIGHVDSFRNYLVNQEEVVFEFTKSDMNFELGKCYIGRTRFTIS